MCPSVSSRSPVCEYPVPLCDCESGFIEMRRLGLRSTLVTTTLLSSVSRVRFLYFSSIVFTISVPLLILSSSLTFSVCRYVMMYLHSHAPYIIYVRVYTCAVYVGVCEWICSCVCVYVVCVWVFVWVYVCSKTLWDSYLNE